jgi:serine/threonine-protein kinase
MPDIRNGGTYFLGRYRIVDEIGIGGMASVHLARMDGPGGFQKWVAIKKIHPHLVEDESFVQMFLDEARVAARISHPNVATVFDLGKHEDTYWIAMEYLHGEPLREVMRRTEELGTAMPPEIACRVIADAAEGLHAAHELLGKNGEKLGLVHRDVTPHNLFVTYDGVTKVVDFGIAKFSSRMSHTRAGTLKGKLAYMSPEQVHGEGIDRRTDIFALGVVLWELTTGQRLFRMESDLDTLAKVQECNVPRPSTLIRGYPVDLEKIVMKALAKNRGERFRTARELSRALQSLLMRRGLFIASDEVAAYTQSIFTDRIQKREAHLRWAAEVTQTINVDQMLSKPKIGPEYTNSEVQASMSGKPMPRPAAGLPAMSGPMAEPAPPSHAYPEGGPPPITTSVPVNLKETGPTFPTQQRPAPAAPRPAAGRPPTMQGIPRPAPPPQQAPSDDFEHPSDNDGPTIQALTPMDDEPSTTGQARAPVPVAPRSEPPTMMDRAPESAQNDGPTMMAPPSARAAMMANSAKSDPAMPIEPELEEDQDETMVAQARHRAAAALQAPPMFPNPPSGGRDLQRPVTAQQQRPFASTAAMQGGPSPLGPQMSPLSPQNFSAPPPSPARPNLDFDPFGGGMPHENEFARAASHAPQDYLPRPGQVPTGPSGDFMQPSPSNRMQPTARAIGGVPTYLTNGGGTMTAERAKRRPPMWVVAALSCSIALLIAGVVIAIYTTASGPSARTNGPGPFTSARTDFNKVTNGTGPTSSAAPNVTSVPPVAAPGADPSSTAAAAVTTPPVAPPTPSTTVTAPATAAPTAPAATAAATTARPASTPTPPPATAHPAAPATTAAPVKNALGAITVVCMPKCDQIVDNGTPLGPGHIFNRPVQAGRHTLQLSAPNGVKKNLVVEVVPEQTREVRISMDR